MHTHHVRRLILPFCASALLSGCASFNDTLVIDIGEQFEVLDLQVDRGTTAGNGFECDFDARSKRESLLGGERLVSGTIRCRPLGD